VGPVLPAGLPVPPGLTATLRSASGTPGVASSSAADLRAAAGEIGKSSSSRDARILRRDRRLRLLVKRFRGCLADLPRRERRVLVLRAGLHGRPKSRRAVAHMTGWSDRRVRHLEHAGLRALRRLAASGACGGTATAGGADIAGGNPGRGVITSLPSGAGNGAAVASLGPVVLGERAAGTQARLERSAPDPVLPPLGDTVKAAGRIPLQLLVGLGFLLILGVLVAREARR
jgi:Sigma-70, region 4